MVFTKPAQPQPISNTPAPVRRPRTRLRMWHFIAALVALFVVFAVMAPDHPMSLPKPRPSSPQEAVEADRVFEIGGRCEDAVTLRARDAVVYRGKRIVVDWAERARQSNDPVINEACKDWLALQAELDGRQEQRGKPDWDKLEQLKREYDAKFRGASK